MKTMEEMFAGEDAFCIAPPDKDSIIDMLYVDMASLHVSTDESDELIRSDFVLVSPDRSVVVRCQDRNGTDGPMLPEKELSVHIPEMSVEVSISPDDIVDLSSDTSDFYNDRWIATLARELSSDTDLGQQVAVLLQDIYMYIIENESQFLFDSYLSSIR